VALGAALAESLTALAVSRHAGDDLCVDFVSFIDFCGQPANYVFFF
jgi:hypothetical protein